MPFILAVLSSRNYAHPYCYICFSCHCRWSHTLHIQSLFPHREVCTYPAVERHSLLRQCNLSRESISSVLSLWTQAIISNMSCIFTTVTEMMLEAGKSMLSCAPDYSYSLPFLDTSILIPPCPLTAHCCCLRQSWSCQRAPTRPEGCRR